MLLVALSTLKIIYLVNVRNDALSLLGKVYEYPCLSEYLHVRKLLTLQNNGMETILVHIKIITLFNKMTS